VQTYYFFFLSFFFLSFLDLYRKVWSQLWTEWLAAHIAMTNTISGTDEWRSATKGSTKWLVGFAGHELMILCVCVCVGVGGCVCMGVCVCGWVCVCVLGGYAYWQTDFPHTQWCDSFFLSTNILFCCFIFFWLSMWIFLQKLKHFSDRWSDSRNGVISLRGKVEKKFCVFFVWTRSINLSKYFIYRSQ
jgi:hypothetical protein